MEPNLANMTYDSVTVKVSAKEIRVPTMVNVKDIKVGDEICVPLQPRVVPLRDEDAGKRAAAAQQGPPGKRAKN